MIEGVIIKDVKRYHDGRGFFNEIARDLDSEFDGNYTDILQVSHGLRYGGISNGWHVHTLLCEWLYVITGEARIVLKDCRTGVIRPFIEPPNANGKPISVTFIYRDAVPYSEQVWFGLSKTPLEYDEIYASEYSPKAIYIPAGVAHGYKVIQGPCHMVYIASRLYDPNDEGRIEWNRWPEHNWARDIETK